MDISAFRRSRISIVVAFILIAGLVFFVFSLFSAMRRSDQVEESQLRLIVDKLQLENRVMFSSIESAVKLEGKKIESGSHFLTNKSDMSFLKNLIDITDKVAAIGIISEDGEEFAIQKRNNLFASYYYNSALDSIANVTIWDAGKRREVADTLVGNRMYKADIFQVHANEASGKPTWRATSDLPGIATRRGLSASILVTDTITLKRYIVIFFVPFKRMMTNTVSVGHKKGDVFIFRNDSLYFNFDGTNDSATGFDTTTYFVPWKNISVKKHSDAIKTWQSLDSHDSIQLAKFKSGGVHYSAAFNHVVNGRDGTYYALVVPSATLPTLFRSRSGALLLVAFIVLLITAIVFAVVYVKKFKKVRFVELTTDEVKKMISVGESNLLEFKSTIRTNLHTGKPGKEIELAWLKSVVAFCNTEGGTILLGVNDKGDVLGLEADNFQNDDKCLLHIQNLISEHVGVEYLSYVRFHLLGMEDKKILVVQCAPLKRIMLLKSSGKEQFYVRSGPSSIELPMSKVLEYVNDRKKTF